MPRVERLGPLATVIVVSVAAHSIPPPSDTTAHGLKTTHAVGYYDATLQRVVLVGSAVDPRVGDRDHVWSWAGAGWESITLDGPSARSNAAAAYDAGRGIAVVSGGARYAADSAFVVISDTWEGPSGKWHPFSGTDIEPRDHQAMVYDAGRDALLMFGGIPAKRSEPWPSDTRELRPEGWVRVATEVRHRVLEPHSPMTRCVGRSCCLVGLGPHRDQARTSPSSTTPGSGRPVAGGSWRWTGPRALCPWDGIRRTGRLVLLYSGAAAHRNAPLTDMWQWDGKRWTEIRSRSRRLDIVISRSWFTIALVRTCCMAASSRDPRTTPGSGMGVAGRSAATSGTRPGHR